MKVLLDEPPVWAGVRKGFWPASWIDEARVEDVLPQVKAFRLRFEWAKAGKVRLHVTADERYELYLDGVLIGRGSERGDERNWFFESLDVRLEKGSHVLVARVWHLGSNGPAAFAQHSVRAGFLLAAEGKGISPELLNTGKAGWEVKRLAGFETRPNGDAWGTGAKLRVVGSEVDWEFASGEGEGWKAAVALREGVTTAAQDSTIMPQLRPAVLPAMVSAENKSLRVRHVAAVEKVEEVYKQPILAAENLEVEQAAWNAMLSGKGVVEIPAGESRRVLMDAGNYVCAYPRLVTSGGKGAVVRAFWMESLVEELPGEKQWVYQKSKGDRGAVEGKFFWGYPWGVGDEFVLEGGSQREYRTLWWEAGRYFEMTIQGGQEAVRIEGLHLEETHYPYVFTGRFDSADEKLPAIVDVSLRTLEMCSHETFMDCPFFEQLQYIGDTRLQALVGYVTCADSRLARKAVEMFDASRDATGLTQSRYPSAQFQRIPPFSLWWVGMVFDYALWRDDAGFVKDRLRGVRAVLDAYASHVDERGLLGTPKGWNYVDWGPRIEGGVPKDGADGFSGVIGWQYALALTMAVRLEDGFGEPEVAALQRRRAKELSAALVKHFYDARRGLMADDQDHSSWSEHAQCLSLLTGLLPDRVARRVGAGMLTTADLIPTSIYFSHYLFETLRHMEQLDVMWQRMGLWHELIANNLKTTIEGPEPTRSDCHAWGAHPVYHFHASVLGVRPMRFGFKEVEIQPQLGGLAWAKGETVHPLGMIKTAFEVGKNGKLAGEIVLPAGVSGVLVNGVRRKRLKAGVNRV